MFSVILATALSTTATSTQQWGGCWGQSYCQGYVSCGCCGGCGGCYGSQCSGCWGCRGYGCQGYYGCQCSGWGCQGGYGCQCSGGWGCQGGYGAGWGCQGGCVGGWGYGNLTPQAAYASYGVNPPYLAYSAYGSQIYQGCVGGGAGCYGCYGGWSCYGSPISGTSTVPAPKVVVPSEQAPAPPKEKDMKDDKKPAGKNPLDLGVENRIGNRATIVVVVPEEAKVFIDGMQMKSTKARRVFQTPVLQEGETYFYDIRVDMVRDGKTVSETRRVVINPGQRVAANFDAIAADPARAVAQAEEE